MVSTERRHVLRLLVGERARRRAEARIVDEAIDVAERLFSRVEARGDLRLNRGVPFDRQRLAACRDDRRRRLVRRGPIGEVGESDVPSARAGEHGDRAADAAAAARDQDRLRHHFVPVRSVPEFTSRPHARQQGQHRIFVRRFRYFDAPARLDQGRGGVRRDRDVARRADDVGERSLFDELAEYPGAAPRIVEHDIDLPRAQRGARFLRKRVRRFGRIGFDDMQVVGGASARSNPVCGRAQPDTARATARKIATEKVGELRALCATRGLRAPACAAASCRAFADDERGTSASAFRRRP